MNDMIFYFYLKQKLELKEFAKKFKVDTRLKKFKQKKVVLISNPTGNSFLYERMFKNENSK